MPGTIGESKLWTFLPNRGEATPATCTQVRASDAVSVKNYMDLARRIAELQFRNREYVLMFRGQRGEYRNRRRHTMLKPTLFRSQHSQNPDSATLQARFEQLKTAERILAEEYTSRGKFGRDNLAKQKVLRWSILQHYEVCPTPLLDVTHSLRIAASFASDAADKQAFVFVIGVPNLSGAVTASAEAALQIVRLSSICPPSAVRPHIQEGYLLGEYPELGDYDQKQLYHAHEIDFGRRLVAKFRFNPRTFWKRSKAFPPIPHAALYPDRRDPLLQVAAAVRRRLGTLAS